MDNLVSLIVPIYNVEDYLDRCVESIVNQTYGNLEIILVDDGSTDTCSEKCDCWKCKDDRIQVIHQKNAGAGIARNTGIHSAKGKYVFFIDSDDAIDPFTVERCVMAAEETDSEIIVFGRYNIFLNGKKEKFPIKIEKTVFRGENIVNQFLPGLFTYSMGTGISACCKMFRLDLLNDHTVRFPSERKVISEDAFFCLDAVAKAEVVTVIPDCLYYYYKREGSLSTKYKADRQHQNDLFLMELLKRAEDQHLSVKVANHMKSKYHSYTLAALMQIEKTNLSGREKKNKLDEIMDNPILAETLGDEVVCLDPFFSRLFWKLLRRKKKKMCRLLLWLKAGF